MEIIGYICAVAATGAFIALAVYEWLLWRERTKAEILKLKAETHFLVAAADAVEGVLWEEVPNE